LNVITWLILELSKSFGMEEREPRLRTGTPAVIFSTTSLGRLSALGAGEGLQRASIKNSWSLKLT
jgi:hypothetical protein